MAGRNLLWHTRYDDAGNRYMVRECRACANTRYRLKRQADKRNRKLEALAVSDFLKVTADSNAPDREDQGRLYAHTTGRTANAYREDTAIASPN